MLAASRSEIWCSVMRPAVCATEAVAPARMLAPVPSGNVDRNCSVVPIAYLTALYGLKRIAGLKKGQSVLIHAAAGGVGLAAVQIAKRQGAEIFATAGSEEKRAAADPKGVRHVLNSRSLDFADQILALTQNRGVDVVLNSLAGDFIPASLRSLANGGYFLELGKREIWSADAVASRRPDVGMPPYDLGEEIGKDPNLFSGMMDELIVAWSEGRPRPLPVTSIPDRTGARRHALHGAGAARRENRPHNESGQGETRRRSWSGMGPIGSPAAWARWARKPRGGSRATARGIWF